MDPKRGGSGNATGIGTIGRWIPGLALGALLLGGCGGEAPSTGGAPPDLDALLEGIDPEIAQDLKNEDKIVRIGGIVLLDSVDYDRRLAILEALWAAEQEPDVRSHIVDAMALAEGEPAVRFLERVVVGPETVDLRDSAVYYLSLPGLVDHVDLDTMRGVLYQPDLSEDLPGMVMMVLAAMDTTEARAVLRQVAQDHTNWEVRLSAVFVLASLDDRDSLPIFQKRLETEESAEVRQALERAIEKLDGGRPA